MDNQTIIFQESLRLMDAGILRGSGHTAKVQTEEGEKEIEIPEQIHTYQTWKQLGFTVTKGQHARAKFQIWIPKKRKKEVKDQTEEQQPQKQEFIMRTAAFFTEDQVEPINK